MKLTRLLIVLQLCATVAGAANRSEAIVDLIRRGDILQARQDLERLPQGALPASDQLLLIGLLESRGFKSRQLLDSALVGGIDERLQPEATLRLLQAAEACDDSAAVLTLADRFLHRWPNDSLVPHVVAALTDVLPDGGQRQKQFLDRLIADYGQSYFGNYARLATADQALRAGKYREATDLCLSVNDVSDDALAPAALVLLASIALKDDEAEKALLNYNILREGFEHAVGQTELTEALRRISDRKSTVEEEEKLSGITYAVQIGVFAVKDNARRAADRLKTYGYPTRVSEMVISGKRYSVVRAGRFATEQEAKAAKTRLERGENELYKVVVNDDK
jgi:hypothetical protein